MRHLWSVACNCSTRQKPSRTTPTTTGGLRRHDPQELFSRIRSHVYSLEGRPCSDPIYNVECEDATPKTQNCLNSHSTPSWAMAPERCALSGCSHGRTFGEQQAEEYRCPRAFVKVTRLRRRGVLRSCAKDSSRIHRRRLRCTPWAASGALPRGPLYSR